MLPVRGLPRRRGSSIPLTLSQRKLVMRRCGTRSSFSSSFSARGSKLTLQAKSLDYLFERDSGQVIFETRQGDHVIFLFVEELLQRLFDVMGFCSSSPLGQALESRLKFSRKPDTKHGVLQVLQHATNLISRSLKYQYPRTATPVAMAKMVCMVLWAA